MKKTHTKTIDLFRFSSFLNRKKKNTKWAISQKFLPASLVCSKDCDHIV